jgi:plasmid maintenance system antidote protein VapI
VIGQPLTEAEQENGRRALRYLRVRAGGWKALATALGFHRKSITNVSYGDGVSVHMVFRIARLAGVSVEDVISGRFPPPGACPHCGHTSGGG